MAAPTPAPVQISGTPRPPRLRIAGAGKRYGDVVALQPTTLDVAAGEFLTLLGPSGSGKTTLLSLVAGLAVPDGGHIELDGRDVTTLPPHARGLGMVFQNYALFPHLSVLQNVGFGLVARRLPVADVDRRARDALAMVRLQALAERLPGELSGGQQQRVALARALAYAPDLVLMDEPLGALDRHLREEMKAEIARLHRELGVTVLYVTHDQEEALVLSDRICLMNQARIEQLDTPRGLYFAPQTRFAAEFIGESNLLPATWEGDRLRLPELGPQVVLDGLAAPGQLPPRPLLLLRPEALQLQPLHSAHPGDWRGTLSERTFLGALTRSVVQVGEHRLRVLSPTLGAGSDPAFAVGAPVAVRVRLDACHLLAA